MYKYFTEDELERTGEELEYIEKHSNEYKSYDNINDLKGAIIIDE